jgi:hypothetical protein
MRTEGVSRAIPAKPTERCGLAALYLCLLGGAALGFVSQLAGELALHPLHPLVESWKWAALSTLSIIWFPYAIWRLHLRKCSPDTLVVFLVLHGFIGWETMSRLARFTWGLGYGGC